MRIKEKLRFSKIANSQISSQYVSIFFCLVLYCICLKEALRYLRGIEFYHFSRRTQVARLCMYRQNTVLLHKPATIGKGLRL